MPTEVALKRATGKFTKRFQALERALCERGRKPDDCTLAEMDAIWEEIKRGEVERVGVEAGE